MPVKKLNLKNLIAYSLVSCLSFNAYSEIRMCTSLFETARGIAPQKINWHDDISFIKAFQEREISGKVTSYFSKKWDTQIYQTNTALPNIKGEIPLVDPDSKGVFIFFHGSGTKKTGGKNFIGNLNTLANLGYSGISFDMPFHSEGPRSQEFNNSNYFMEWTRSIILEAKKSGKPVYLAGHSFGPDVMLELATRYPKLVDGVVALSPAGFTKELSKWYDNHTTKMNFGGNVESNDDGGRWAATMSNQFLWSKSKLADPTVVNPDLKISILSGNREEYVPAPTGGPNNTPIGDNTYDIKAPLQKIFRNAKITIEPGIGHYIFEHVDQNGLNVVNRELLLIANESPDQIKKLIEAQKAENNLADAPTVVGKKYAQDRLFREWADITYGKNKALQISKNSQEGLAQKMLKQYSLAEETRNLEIHKRILNSKTTHPEFYLQHKNLIDSMNPNKIEKSLFVPFMTMIEKSAQ